MTDWNDLGRTWSIGVEMVDPANIDASLGMLDGVDLSGCSITEGYYTDSRMSAKLRTVDGNWRRQSMLRVVATTDGYREELGTFIVTGDDTERTGGATVAELECQSLLYAMSLRTSPWTWTIGEGSTAAACMRQVLDANGRKYNMSAMSDATFTDTVVMTGGDNDLARLFSLCEMSGNRLDVDGHGRVTVQRYRRPADRGATFTIDVEGGLVFDGIKRTSDYLTMPSECHVVYRKTEKDEDTDEQVTTEIVGSAYASGHVSFAQRGYIVSNYVSASQLNPASQAHAHQLAVQYLSRDSVEDVHWELTCEYMPLHEGDVGWLQGLTDVDGYGGRRKVLVQSVELELEHMTMKLTLKSAESIDSNTDSDDDAGETSGEWVEGQDDAWWWFKRPDGTYPRNGWFTIDGERYLFDANGWISWPGWQRDGGSWYYIHPDHDGRYGAADTGWLHLDGKWYYLDPLDHGRMVTGKRTIDGTEYEFGADGALKE